MISSSNNKRKSEPEPEPEPEPRHSSPLSKRGTIPSILNDEPSSSPHTHTLAYLGPPGSHSHAAALSLASTYTLIPSPTIQSVFESVCTKHTVCGLVPIQNSKSGFVSQSLDSFIKYADAVRIIDELYHVVHQSVLGVPNPDTDWKTTITQVYSQPEALAQVKTYLDTTFPPAAAAAPPAVARIPVSSTSFAAQLASSSPYTSIAICSAVCAQLYNLTVLAENVEDASDNTTRFVLVAPRDPGPGPDPPPHATLKVHVMLTPRPAADIGTILALLRPDSQCAVRIEQLASRPSAPSAPSEPASIWCHTYFIELATPHMRRVHEWIARVETHCISIHVLGSCQR
ncbi:prephenate dehydratase [Synchytrium endobioticum]|uniref:prephenate dehydratase n=1 Tax=Synchytrium endobioticum TaxID=286115 RepID=A0A507DE44_9FUNG|nr:prephenate dehydratase [Synchytrium endobioticum]